MNNQDKLSNVPLRTLVDDMKVMSVYYLKEAHEKIARNKQPYCDLVLRDRSGETTARLWGALGSLVPFSYVLVEGHTETYLDSLRLIVDKIGNVEEEQVDVRRDFVEETPDLPNKRKRLNEFVKQISEPTLRALTRGVFTERFTEQFSTVPASEGARDGVVGGTLTQSLRILDAVSYFISTYLCSDDSRHELALVGALLSNTGKVIAYDFVDNVPVITLKGRLFGDVALSYQRLIMVITSLKQRPQQAVELAGTGEGWLLDEDVLLRLTHVILSSRSAAVNPGYVEERRCVVLPQSLEAVVVSQAYLADEQGSDVYDVIKATELNDNVPDDPLTPYDSRTKRRFLKR